jgi:hypothetical protein
VNWPRKDPDAYLPGVARMLHSLGPLNSGEHRTEHARQEYDEALKIYRELARQDPIAYLPRVALVLYNLGLPIQAVAVVLLCSYQSGWFIPAAMAGFSIALLVAVGLFGWRFRHSVASSMATSGGDSEVGATGLL